MRPAAARTFPSANDGRLLLANSDGGGLPPTAAGGGGLRERRRPVGGRLGTVGARLGDLGAAADLAVDLAGLGAVRIDDLGRGLGRGGAEALEFGDLGLRLVQRLLGGVAGLGVRRDLLVGLVVLGLGLGDGAVRGVEGVLGLLAQALGGRGAGHGMASSFLGILGFLGLTVRVVRD